MLPKKLKNKKRMIDLKVNHHHLIHQNHINNINHIDNIHLKNQILKWNKNQKFQLIQKILH